MKRQSNGFSWVVVINSSSWKGPRLPAYVNYMMGKIEKSINNWPKQDLFKYTPKKIWIHSWIVFEVRKRWIMLRFIFFCLH